MHLSKYEFSVDKLLKLLLFVVLFCLIAFAIISTIDFIMVDTLGIANPSILFSIFQYLFGKNSILSNYAESYFLLVFSFIFIYLIFRLFRRQSDETSETHEKKPKFRLKLPVIIGILSLTIFIVSFRYLSFLGAQGCDTPVYLGAINDINHLNFTQVIGTGRDITIFVIYLIYSLASFFVNFESSIMIIPIVLTIFYVFSIYYLVKVGTKSEVKALITAAIAPLSFFVTRLSYDLYSQLFGLTMMFIALAFYLQVLEGNKRLLLPTVAIFAIALFSHTWTWVIFICALPIFLLLSGKEELSGKTALTLKVLIPSIILLALSYVFQANISSGLMYTYTVGELHFFSLPVNWDWIVIRESTFIWFFSIIGLVTISLIHKYYYKLILSLIFAFSIITIVLGYDQSYRLLLIFPIPLIVGEGVYFLTTKFTSYFQYRLSLSNIQHRLITLMILLLSISILLASAIPRATIVEYIYRPTIQGMNQLSWIQNHYGYGNNSILILVQGPLDDPENRLRWTQAITGADVYKGDLVNLISGRTFQIDQSHWQTFNFSDYSEIILPGALYSITSLEKSIATQIANNLYSIKNINYSQIESLIKTSALLIEDDFSQNWINTANQISHSFSFSNGDFYISNLTFLGSTSCRLTYEKLILCSDNFSKIVVQASGNLTNISANIEIYYKDATSDSLSITSFIKLDPSIYATQLSSKSVDRIEITISPASLNAFSNCWLEINYIALF